MRKIVIGLVLVVAVLIGGIAFIIYNLDALVKELVQKVGSEMTQTEVALQDVNIDATQGKASMSGLTVANPVGYKEPLVLSLGGISIKMDPATVTSDVIRIHEIVVAAPAVTVEVKDDGSTNVQQLQSNVESFTKKLEQEVADATGGSSGGSESSSGGGDSAATEGPKVIIENFYIRDVEANLNMALLGGETFSLPAPDLHLQGIGEKENGVLASDAAAQVMDAFLGDLNAVTLESDAMKLLGKAGEEVGKAVEQISEEAGKLAKELENATGVEGLGEDVGKEADKLLNNLFGN